MKPTLRVIQIIALMALLNACFLTIVEVDQPLEIAPGDSFVARITAEFNTGRVEGSGGFFMFLPTGWLVPDSIAFSGDTTGLFYRDSNSNYTPPIGYDLWYGRSQRTQPGMTGSILIEIPIQTNGQTGPHYLTYGGVANGETTSWSSNHLIWSGEFQRVSADLYVSPTGSDLNSGLSESEPLRTVNCALHKIDADALNPRTITLMEGIYSNSPSLITPSTWNGLEHYPLMMKDHVSIQGVSQRDVVLASKSEVTIIAKGVQRVNISGLTLSGTVFEEYGGGILIDSALVSLQSLTLKDSHKNENHPLLQIINCLGENTIQIDSVTLLTDDLDQEALMVLEQADVVMSNSILGRNQNFLGHLSSGTSLAMDHCTLYSGSQSGQLLSWDTAGENNLDIQNSILWGSLYSLMGGTIEVNYSAIPGGWTGTENLDVDPLFCYPHFFEYSLQEDSPCIGAAADGSNMGAGEIGCLLGWSGSTWYVAPIGSDSPSLGSPANPFRTIQYALDLMSSGDTLIAFPGTYSEGEIDFQGKNITMGSLFLLNDDESYISTTIVNNGRVIFDCGEDSSAQFIGFTLGGESGANSGIDILGGSTPTIRHCVVSGNEGNLGVGIHVNGSLPTLENLIIKNNSGGYGSGIYVENADGLRLDSLSITDNYAEVSGAGLVVRYSTVELNGVTFAGNVADNNGSAIANYYSGLVVRNSIVYGNEGQAIKLVAYDSTDGLTIDHSDIQDGVEGVYGNPEFVNWGDGNIVSDPGFCLAGGFDYYLAANSPCVGTGSDGGNMGYWGVGCGNMVSTVDYYVPDDYELYQNYPNPFNPNTTIAYDLPENSEVRITVYDIVGHEVATLVSENQPAGNQSIQWNGRDYQGRQIMAGMYLYRIQAGSFSNTRKMLLVK